MTSISSSNSTEMGHVASAPPPEQPTGTAEHPRPLAPRTRLGPSTTTNPTVSLVIPVRNEARNIGWVLEQITCEVTEIILVDGNSTDVTLVTARRSRPDILVVPQQGAGKGSALRTGFLAATGDIIVMMDADGSMSPSEIPHYVHFLANGYDFVKGSRFITGGASLDITWFRRLGNRFLLTVFNALYDGHLTDLCYGFCAFDRRYLEHLHLSATGFEIEAEITVRAMRAGLRITEVPSIELPRRSGKSNLHAIRDGFRVLRTVLRDHRSGVSGHLVQGARQLRYAARPVRDASTAFGEQ
jgi:glycosyltransferase involved in cell wall biosynthesis